ncbi:MAG: HNH endonuclease [Bacilli bacterium]|nr:HNH endonuclease [Bacilli bacterium]
MATVYNLENVRVGKLTVKTLVPKEKRPTQNHGNYWYCDCDCGNKDVMIPTTYLTGKGNYTQQSCGCDRKIKAFLASSKIGIDENFLNQFDDFEKFLFLHKQLTLISGKTAGTYNLEEYKEDILYFYNDNQFNKIYLFWKQQERENTYYDWAKPSLDHIVPKSRGGNNKKENLQFLTVFENLSKRDMTWEEWQSFKRKTHSQSDYYLENII